MGMGKIGNGLAAAALLASPVSAENLHPAAQTERGDYPFAEEMAIITETRERALATCNANFAQRYMQLGAFIEDGQVVDREGLITLLEDMGAPDGEMDAISDQELTTAALSMPGTNQAMCQRDAYQAEGESYEALSAVLQDNIAALRAETASLQDLLRVLEQLEALAGEDEAILAEIQRLRESTAQSNVRAAEYAAEIERIWDRIARDSV